ncbi:MAG: hypothetical protein ABIB61_00305 [Candidatus Shapirobacteria bacterium]
MVLPKLTSGAYLIISQPKDFLKISASLLKEKDLSFTNNPDWLFLDSPQTGIDEIRKLKNFFNQKKWGTGKRIVFIAHGQGLSQEAQNALLKTLEELRENNFVFIGATNPTLLLPTIISRSQVIFPPANKISTQAKPLSLEKITKLPIPERFLYFDKNFNSDILFSTIIFYQKKLVKKKRGLKRIKKWLESCLRAQVMLEANLRPETVVDWLLLNL